MEVKEDVTSEAKTNYSKDEIYIQESVSAVKLEHNFTNFLNTIITEVAGLKSLVTCAVAFLNDNINIYSDTTFTLSTLESNKQKFSDLAVRIYKSNVKFQFIQEDDLARFKQCKDFISIRDEEKNDDVKISNIAYIESKLEDLSPLEEILMSKFKAKRIY